MIRLRPRLLTAASFVRGGGRIVDIGTDHAYLPVYLIQQGIVQSAIASDVGEGPLRNAEKTLRQYGLQAQISLRLSDGLKNILPDEADEILICGMGGNLIEEILLAAPWVRRPGMHLVLQPMTHSQDVRRYLCNNGFAVSKELCSKDSGRVYLTLSADYTGEDERQNVGYYYFGSQINVSGDGAVYVQKQLAWVRTRLNAITQADRFPDEQRELRGVLEYYDMNKALLP